LVLCAIDLTGGDLPLEHPLLSANATSGENERVLGQMMKRFDMGLSLAVCFAAMIRCAVANAETGTYVSGIGANSCGEFIASIGKSPPGKHEYASQFLDRDSRAHHGQSKLNSRLCSIGQFDPDDWNFPPKPKWMRWKTYKRYQERFERHEAQLDAGLEKMVARLKLFESK
jgi:hypothetical protein